MAEWPAAHDLLAAAGDRLDWILAGKKATAERGGVGAGYKAIALDVLAGIIQIVGKSGGA